MASNGGTALEVKRGERELPAFADFFAWNPFDVINFRPNLRSLFDLPAFYGKSMPASKGYSFDVDLKQKDGKYIAECALPGFKKEEIDIQVRGNAITVTAKSEGETKEDRGTYVYGERHSGEYFRTIPFPTEVDPRKVEASYKDGVLSIAVPAPVQAKTEKIEIKG